VVTSWRPGVAERLGLGHLALAAANPRLVYCSITGFGPKGPWAGLKGYDGVVAAKAGVMTMADGGRPRYAAVPGASFSAAHGALQGILAALYQREATGRGQQVEASLLQALHPYDMYAWLDQPQIPAHMTRHADGTTAGATTYAPISGIIAFTRDGKCLQFASWLPHQRADLLKALDLEAEFAAVGEDQAAIDRLLGLGRERVRQKTFAEWEAIFAAHPNIAVDAFRTGEEAMEHPQLIHNGDVVAIDDPERGPTRQIGPFVTLAATPARLGAPAPTLGQHDDLTGFTSAPTRSPAPPPGAPPRPPLDGVTVIELAWFYAAPYGVALLADLGARIIKVENLDGDPHRRQAGLREFSGVKGLQGKESVAVDTRTPEGMEIVHRLVARADLLLRNFREGAARRMGIDYESLARHNPKLFYLYAGAYGADGPYAARPAYATTISVAVGENARQVGWAHAFDVDAPVYDGEAPLTIQSTSNVTTNADSTAAVSVGSAMVLGLLARQRLGVGQLGQSSMMATNAYIVSDDFVRYQGKVAPPVPDPDALGLGPLYRLYPAAAGWVFLAAPRPDEWDGLCRLVRRVAGGEADLAADARLRTLEDRARRPDALAEALAAAFAKAPAQVWEREAAADDVACVEVSAEPLSRVMMGHPAMTENGYVGEVEHPYFGRHRRHGPLVSMTSPATLRPACLIGQHTRAVLAEIGYSQAEIEALRDRGVVAWP
jgi:crotonobetainyl-CoA:carnitine CoA-transferase CaiB-like acyl-CoA transferase